MTNYPETHKDKLEAYPLRLNVAALPERRFFKMTRTLTVLVVLLSALLVVFGVYLNYQITHLDVSVRRGSAWQFYRIDPEEKRLKIAETTSVGVDAMYLVVEEKLIEYLKLRNSTVWTLNTMEKNFGMSGPIFQISSSDVFKAFDREAQAMLSKTRGAGLIRDVHIYSLKNVGPNLWSAIIETFDLPITDDLISECPCTDNSKECLNCKISKAKNRERKKIWIRTSFARKEISEQMCNSIHRVSGKEVCFNPLGISIDKYISTFLPIHPNATYWDLPPDLRPEI